MTRINAPARSVAVLAGLALAGTFLPHTGSTASSDAGTALATGAVAADVAVVDMAAGGVADDDSPQRKLHGDLAQMVAGERSLDARIPPLVAGHQPGELPYFVVLSAPKSATDRADLEATGARILREYRSVDAFAVASQPSVLLDVAALDRVGWLAPVELVVALEEPVVDQTRSHTADVGADEAWSEGLTGAGVRIAILDTGVDPIHPDLDDLDFGHWSDALNDPKVVDARDFNGSVCRPLQADGHGHGTHVAGIATGTGEGGPTSDDDGRHAGIAPGAELAVAKVLTDAGAGINSDLVAAMEWAAMPEDFLNSAIGADIVNLSLGSEARPTRLNSDSDVDFVGYVLNRLAVEYGTLFVVAAGNSGPYVGSVLEAPGSAAQALSVAATAKDWDLNHDDTASGETCSGWRHPRSPSSQDNDCRGGVGDQPPSIAAFSSRGPSGDVWLRPDIAAPGYNIVSAQSTTGAAIAQNDLSSNTRTDPLYATATGTSMASPATAGSAALVLQAYRDRHGVDPVGSSGRSDLDAPAYALLRAALMNSAGGDLFESRWILTPDAGTSFECPDPDPLFGLCGIVEIFTDFGSGSLTLYEARNQGSDPYVGPLAEGAGKLDVGRAITALRDGVVMYSAAGDGVVPGAGHQDFQGSWQVGPVRAGDRVGQQFVIHAAPDASPDGGIVTVDFAFSPGNPSDGSRVIDAEWLVELPAPTPVVSGGDRMVTFSLVVPPDAPPGAHTGTVLVTTSAGQSLRIPVFASVALHDPDRSDGNVAGPQAAIVSARDVYAKGDTMWPSVLGAAGGSLADWLVYPVDLGDSLTQLRVSVFDAASGDETYDLYLYDARLDLIASTHPFVAPGVTDADADAARPATTEAAPQVLLVDAPAGGRHYLAVSRSRVGGTSTGDFGAFSLTLDEIGPDLPPPPTDTQAGMVHGAGFWNRDTGDKHDKVDFSFDVKVGDNGPTGKLRVHDKDAGVKLDAKTITSVASGAGTECAGVTLDGSNSFVFTASGEWEFGDARGSGTFVACGVDNGKNNAAPIDHLHVRCAAGCEYDSSARVPDGAIAGGNIHLREPIVDADAADADPGAPADDGAAAPFGDAEVVTLEAVSDPAAGGEPVLMIAVVEGSAAVMPSADVTLRWVDAGGATREVHAVTDALGTAVFVVDAIADDVEYRAAVGALESNGVWITAH